MTPTKVRGSIPAILQNGEELYEGNLVPYFGLVLRFAQNLRNPYHNFKHMFHVLWLCHEACRFYKNTKNTLSPREARNLLIAAMFHDFDHTGRSGNDDLNIELALRGLKKCLLNEDAMFFDDIAAIIRPTEFPYKVAVEELPLLAQILRDADVAQAFSQAWIQQVVFGLSGEWGMNPIEILKMQKAFLGNLAPATEWGRQMFPREAINAKIAEAEELLAML